MTDVSELHYGPPTKNDRCAYQYRNRSYKCAKWVDFYVKVPDGRGDDWRKAWASCSEHLPRVIWQMQQMTGYGGEYLLRASIWGRKET